MNHQETWDEKRARFFAANPKCKECGGGFDHYSRTMICRKCQIIIYRERARKKEPEYRRNYVKKHRKKIQAYQQRYYQVNREKISEQKKIKYREKRGF